MTEKEKAQAGYLYNANYDKDILDEINKCNGLCYEFNQLKPSEREAQAKLLARILGKVGENICVNAPFWCDYGSNTTVGDYFFANHNCQILHGG
jgi:acetyltransferase-like isoleucine patch superfamily enzyme